MARLYHKFVDNQASSSGLVSRDETRLVTYLGRPDRVKNVCLSADDDKVTGTVNAAEKAAKYSTWGTWRTG
jgi:hypothetical protein